MATYNEEYGFWAGLSELVPQSRFSLADHKRAALILMSGVTAPLLHSTSELEYAWYLRLGFTGNTSGVNVDIDDLINQYWSSIASGPITNYATDDYQNIGFGIDAGSGAPHGYIYRLEINVTG